MENMKKFLASAKSIIENSHGHTKNSVTVALNESWDYYVGGSSKNISRKTAAAIQRLEEKFPGFRPLLENEVRAMNKAKGKGLPQGSASGQMPQVKAGVNKELGSQKDFIKRKPKNSSDTTPTIKGAGAMEALARQDPQLLENVVKLSRHISRTFKESAGRNARAEKLYCIVKEGKEVARTPVRATLAEAVADVEELLLFHYPENVRIVVEYASNGTRKEKLIEMPPVEKRKPIQYEGKSLFRFERNAEIFARSLVGAGYSSRIVEHGWGSGVVSEAPRSALGKIFVESTKK